MITLFIRNIQIAFKTKLDSAMRHLTLASRKRNLLQFYEIIQKISIPQINGIHKIFTEILCKMQKSARFAHFFASIYNALIRSKAATVFS